MVYICVGEFSFTSVQWLDKKCIWSFGGWLCFWLTVFFSPKVWVFHSPSDLIKELLILHPVHKSSLAPFPLRSEFCNLYVYNIEFIYCIVLSVFGSTSSLMNYITYAKFLMNFLVLIWSVLVTPANGHKSLVCTISISLRLPYTMSDVQYHIMVLVYQPQHGTIFSLSFASWNFLWLFILFCFNLLRIQLHCVFFSLIKLAEYFEVLACWVLSFFIRGKVPYMKCTCNVEYHSSGETKCNSTVMNHEVDAWVKKILSRV
jgi:hypothetical protein